MKFDECDFGLSNNYGCVAMHYLVRMRVKPQDEVLYTTVLTQMLANEILIHVTNNMV
jgi:hypothetical protein